jgi:Rrf2 family cysteine metabolism transcriptional repressor
MNRTDRYRLEALIELAESYPERRSTAEIAARREIPSAYLSRLLSELVRTGWVHSRRGAGGGLVLARPPEEISVAEVLTAPLEKPDLPPALGRLAASIDDAVQRATTTISVADLARWERTIAPSDYSI